MKNKRPTQAMKILAYMIEHGWIDHAKAYHSDIACNRLPARINELKKTVRIQDRWKTLPNGKRVKEYALEE